MIVAPTPPPDSPDPQVFLDERLRERFIGLARSVLADAAAAARSAGTTTEPTLLWLDLKDETGMIRYLDAFRDQLGVSRGPLLRPADDDGRLLNDVEWSRRKYGYGDKLKALATEIKKLALAVASMETSHVD